MIKGAISPTPLAPSPSIPGWVSSVEPPSENLIVSGRRLVDRQVLTAQADLFLVTSWSKREGIGSTSKPDQLCCFSKCQLAEVTLMLESCLLQKTNAQLQITVKHKMLHSYLPSIGSSSFNVKASLPPLKEETLVQSSSDPLKN